MKHIFLRYKLASLGLILIVVLIAMCILSPIVSHYNYQSTNFASSLQPPSWQHLFGSDGLGRDLFVRIFIGGRITFEIAICATAMVLLIGVVYGVTSGLIGGAVDMIMMRIVDVLYGIPFLFFSILLLTIFGQSVILSIIAVAVVSWLDIARVVRGQTLNIKHREFIDAAKMSGNNTCQIIIRHVIPNVSGVVIVYAALVVPNVIVLSAVLSFFGLGVTEPMTSWGMLISDGAQNLNAWWLLFFPTLMMVITLLSCAFITNALRDMLDPRG